MIDREGRITESRIVLDQAAVDTLHRAQPFPPPPADLPGDAFEFNVPGMFIAGLPVEPGKRPPK